MSSVTYERRKAVDLAWKNEKRLVLEGKGTRDWTPKEQRELIRTGKVKGYEGHHMKSVDGHITKAGDSRNIQFLTRKEHLKAHKGDFHANTNWYYNPKTEEYVNFGHYKAQLEPKSLKEPLNKSQVEYAQKRAEKYAAEKKAINKQKAQVKNGEKHTKFSKTRSSNMVEERKKTAEAGKTFGKATAARGKAEEGAKPAVSPAKTEAKKEAVTPKAAETPKKAETPAKAETPKKDAVSPAKTEAPKKAEAPAKTEAPKKAEAPAKTEAPKKAEAPAKTEAPKKAETHTPKPTGHKRRR